MGKGNLDGMNRRPTDCLSSEGGALLWSIEGEPGTDYVLFSKRDRLLKFDKELGYGWYSSVELLNTIDGSVVASKDILDVKVGENDVRLGFKDPEEFVFLAKGENRDFTIIVNTVFDSVTFLTEGRYSGGSSVYEIVVSPDAKQIVLGLAQPGSSYIHALWNAVTGEKSYELSELSLSYNQCSGPGLFDFSPDGKRLFMGNITHYNDDAFILFDLETEQTRYLRFFAKRRGAICRRIIELRSKSGARISP